MKKNIFIAAIVAAFLLASCATTKKQAEEYYQKHPEQLAQDCAEKFPIKQDSVGDPVITHTKPADNKDYTGTIDSLKAAANELLEKFFEDSAQLANSKDSTARACVGVVNFYKNKITELTGKINDLNRNYKPCLPDTVYRDRNVYLENTAKTAVANYQRDTAQAAATILRHELGKMQQERDEWKATAKKRFWWIAALIAAIGVATWLRIKRII